MGMGMGEDMAMTALAVGLTWLGRFGVVLYAAAECGRVGRRGQGVLASALEPSEPFRVCLGTAENVLCRSLPG